MEMTSSIVPSGEPQRVVQARVVTCVDEDLFSATATGDMDLFNKYQGDFQCLFDEMKDTALHIYLRYRRGKTYNIEFVRRLVEKCPSLLLQPNEKGEIPLHIVAVKVGALEVVKFIIERTKILQNEDLEMELEATDLIKKRLRMRDEDGNTALHRAAESGDADVVGLLVKEFDADDLAFSAKNKKGETPLYIAAREGNHLSVAEILDKCKSTAHGGPNGTTALHAAILGGRHGRTVSKLIEAEKQLIRERDDKGRTPLHYAAHLGDYSAIGLMLKADASAAYITDKERGMTALHMAAWQGHLHIMKNIISYCPDCRDIVDKNGWNFLHFAVVTIEMMHLKYLFFHAISNIKNLSSRNFLFEKDNNGNTPNDIMFFIDSNSPGYFGLLRLRRRWKSKSYMNAEKKKQIGEILKEIGNKGEVAAVQVHKSFREWEDHPLDKEIVNKTRDSHLVVATLVATVTFAAGIAVYKNESGSATSSRITAFKTFIITDALAFGTSLLAICLYFTSAYVDVAKFEDIVRSILYADILTGFATVASMIAFSTGTYALLESSKSVVMVTWTIGASFSYILVLYSLAIIWKVLL